MIKDNIFKIKNLYFQKMESLNFEDKKEILSWRNDKKIRSMMFNNEEISLESHLEFIDILKKKNDKLYLRVNFKDEKIGVLYFFNLKRSSASWGFYLKPKLIGSGYGILLEYFAMLVAFEKMNLSQLFCETLNINKSVLKIHDYFGNSKVSQNDIYTVHQISADIFKKNKSTNQLLIKNFFI